MKKILSALVCLFSAVPLFADTPVPVAYWDGDFSTLTKGDYALDLNGNTLAEDNASVTISTDYGVLFTSSSAINNSTVLIRCSGIDLASTASQVLFTSRNTGNTADTWKNVTGVYLQPKNAAVHGIWVGAHWPTTGSTEAALPTAYTSLAFQTGQSGGTSLYAIANDENGTATATGIYVAGTLGTSNGAFVGTAIGGPREVAISGISAATGMKISAIAVFDSRLTADQIAAFQFPSEKATAITGTEVTATQINETFGEDEEVYVSLDANATLVLDTTLTATTVHLCSTGSITIKSSGEGTDKPASTELAKLDCSSVSGAVLRSWLDTTQAFGFSFDDHSLDNSTDDSDTTGALYEGPWQRDANSNSGTADYFGDGLSTITWTSKNVYRQATTTNSFLNGYLDDGDANNKLSITVSNIPFETYDVVIYCATDTPDAQFAYKTVNGTAWTYTTATSEGTGGWGATSASRYVPVEGVNTLVVRKLSGDLSIASSKVSTSVRGCIAAIQIKPHEEATFPTLTLGGESASEVNWSDTTKWSETTAPKLGSAILDMEGDSTLVFDTAVNMVGLTTQNATGKTLTLTNATEEAIPITAFDAKDTAKVVIKSGDIAIAKPYNGLYEHDYEYESLTPSGTSSATNGYYKGAGTAVAPVSLPLTGGIVLLGQTTDEATTYYITNDCWSATQTSVVFDKSTVNYGAYTFGIGQADYILNDAKVTAQTFVLSQGGNGRTATITLNGASSLTVTGSSNGDSNGSSVMFGHWNGPSTFTLNDTSAFSAPSAQVLVGLTRNDQTINLNGGTFTAKGIVTSSNATGTNILNLNGASLELGSAGLGAYGNTMAINVNADTTIKVTAVESTGFPIKHPITVAEGKTLTLDVDTSITSATLVFSQPFAGAGKIEATERVNTIKFGTTHDFPNFTGTLTVASDTVISFTQKYEGEEITLPAGFAEALKTGSLALNASDGTAIVGQFTVNADGTITITRAVPVLTVDAAEVEFSDATKWSGKSVPSSGSIVIKNTTGEDATIKVNGPYTFSDIAIVSEDARIGFEYGVGASLSTTAVSVNPSTATLKVTAAESPYQAAISGAGKVETYGDVRFTRPSSFTGGLTVKSGTASTDESAKPSGTNKTNTGFGGGDDADAGQITVEDGACVDIANTVDRCYTYTIAGKGVATTNDDGTVTYSGAMKNSGTGMDDGRRQTKAITLTTNALITADANCWWGLVNNSGSGASSLRLNGYTLTKQGAGDFFLVDTLAPTDSSGTIIVKEGEFSAHKTGCVLNNVVLKMQGTSILDLSANLSGLSKLILSPNVGGLTANNLGARLNASVPVVINAACLDAAKIPSGTESLTLLTGNMDSLTNNTAYTVALGGRFSGYEFAEDGTSLTATLQTLKPFLHYDFNGSAMTVDGAKASDSRNQISSWVNVPALVAKGRNGSSAHVANGSTTYWSSMNATQSALDSAGAITVTTVARLPFVATGTSPLWCLGSGCNGSQASSIILRAVDATTVAALAFDRADNGQNTVGRELARVTGIEDLATKFHFFALVVTGEGTRLYVDRMPTVETEACAPINTMSTAGQLGAIFGNSWKYTQNLGTAGFYLDDWQVYDAILTEKEIQALRRTYCPSPFVLIVQ